MAMSATGGGRNSPASPMRSTVPRMMPPVTKPTGKHAASMFDEVRPDEGGDDHAQRLKRQNDPDGEVRAPGKKHHVGGEEGGGVQQAKAGLPQ